MGGSLLQLPTALVDEALHRRVRAACHDKAHRHCATVALEESNVAADHLVTPSAGFALYGMHGRTLDQLITAADVALTAAKTTGRSTERVSSFVVSL